MLQPAHAPATIETLVIDVASMALDTPRTAAGHAGSSPSYAHDPEDTAKDCPVSV